MRRKRIKRELAALGHPDHIPTDELRMQVRMYAFNKIEHGTIARVLDIPVGVLEYFYWRELSLTEVEVIARATQNVLELASQRTDLGVALKANEQLLRTRSPHWREPRAAEPPPTDDLQNLRVERLTLAQVERALARLGATTVGAGEGDPPLADEPR
jgi:hypothetical protein